MINPWDSPLGLSLNPSFDGLISIDSNLSASKWHSFVKSWFSRVSAKIKTVLKPDGIIYLTLHWLILERRKLFFIKVTNSNMKSVSSLSAFDMNSRPFPRSMDHLKQRRSDFYSWKLITRDSILNSLDDDWGDYSHPPAKYFNFSLPNIKSSDMKTPDFYNTLKFSNLPVYLLTHRYHMQ